MTELDRLRQIKKEAIDVQTKLMSTDIEEVTAAMKKYEHLVDRFSNESGDFMAPQQYETAKKDLEYFMRLIELAVNYHKEG